MRVAYDGKSGHAYTSIGRLAVERGLLAARGRAQGRPGGLAQGDIRRQGRALMRENRSFIFFRETAVLGEAEGPIGAAGVPLTAGPQPRRRPHDCMTFHTPVWVDVPGLPDPAELGRPSVG